MNILVTGGAGYIGSVLVPELLKTGHKVTVIDNFMYNQTPFLDWCLDSNLEIINGDITDQEIIKENVEDKELIIPLACLTGAPLCNRSKRRAEDVIINSLDDLLSEINYDIKVIYPNTNSGYGIGSEGICTEETPLNPISLYGKLKCEAENMVMVHGHYVVFRLATVFGLSPRMRLDLLVNDFVHRAMNDGFIALFESQFRRNYVHIRDVANAFVYAINNWDLLKNNVYNLGDTRANMTKLELAQKIKEYLPDTEIFEGKFRQDKDKRDYIVSNEKLETTGWKPLMTIDSGIKELIKGYSIIKRNQYANI